MTTQSATTHSDIRSVGAALPTATLHRPVTESDRRDSRNRPNFSAPSARTSGLGTPGGMRWSLSVTSGPGQISDGA